MGERQRRTCTKGSEVIRRTISQKANANKTQHSALTDDRFSAFSLNIDARDADGRGCSNGGVPVRAPSKLGGLGHCTTTTDPATLNTSRRREMERILGFAVGTESLVKAELSVNPSTYGRLIGRENVNWSRGKHQPQSHTGLHTPSVHLSRIPRPRRG